MHTYDFHSHSEALAQHAITGKSFSRVTRPIIQSSVSFGGSTSRLLMIRSSSMAKISERRRRKECQIGFWKPIRHLVDRGSSASKERSKANWP
jgi:hypothetical protein